MNAPFFAGHLPEPLLRPGPGGLLWWQWLALPVLLLVFCFRRIDNPSKDLDDVVIYMLSAQLSHLGNSYAP